MRRLRVGIVATGLAALLCGVGEAQAAVVFVYDASLSPSTVTVGVGDRVIWRNEGTGRHSIASRRRRGFTPFKVSAGRSHSVRFSRPGSYRYTMDGSLRGRVEVVAPHFHPSRARCRRGTRGCPRDTMRHPPLRCGQRKRYVYNVLVEGGETWVASRTTYPGRSTGSFHYVSRFTKVPALVERPGCAFAVKVTMPGVVAGDRGGRAFFDDTTTLTMSYANDLGATASPPQRSCAWSGRYVRLEPQLTSFGVVFYDAKGAPTRWGFDFQSTAEFNQAGALGREFFRRQQAACPDHATESPSGDYNGDVSTFRGLDYQPPNPLNVLGQLHAIATGEPVALVRALMHGRSVSLVSPPQHVQNETLNIGWAMKFVFKRVR
jgi:plastocyanin